MTDDRIDKATDEGYSLDLDDTISSWDQVVKEAVEAVRKEEEGGPAVRDLREEVSRDDITVLTAVGDVVDAAPDEAAPAAAADVHDLDAEPDQEPPVHDLDAEPDQEPPVHDLDATAGEAGAPEEEAAPVRTESEEVKNLREQLMRTLADFDNYRKRMEREKASIQRFALFDVLKEFLGVFDNLERALAASGRAEDLKMGVEMIARQFADLLRRHGVEAVEAVGETFDPTVHEAVSREESTTITEPTVTSELQRGYRLHDRLLRPAMVSVAMPVAPPQPAQTATPPPSPGPSPTEPSAEKRPPEENSSGLPLSEEPSADVSSTGRSVEASSDKPSPGPSEAVGPQSEVDEAVGRSTTA